MPELGLQRIPFTSDADNRLRMLKARTGMTPNILARLGFCLSLEEPGGSPSLTADVEFGREINRYTLLGEYDAAFVALLLARMVRHAEPPESIEASFVAHMNRGVELLAARLKSLSDLGLLRREGRG